MVRRRKVESETPSLDAARQNLQPELAVMLSRRKLLGTMGKLAAMFAVGNLVAEQWASEVYSSRDTMLRMDGGTHIRSNLFAVSFGGEGNHDDFYGAATIYSASGKRIPAADMMYDNKNGLDFDSMARVLHQAQKERGFTHLVINGDSFGGLFGLYAAYRANIPVAGFVANCSPGGMRDAKSGAALMADFVTSPVTPKGALVQNAELVGKDLYCYFRDASSIGSAMLGLGHELVSLPSQMADGGSAFLQYTEVQAGRHLDCATLLPVLYRHGIVDEHFTSAVFLQAASDNTVNDNAAYGDWSREFHKIGIHMPRLYMGPGSVHADEHAEGVPLQTSGFLENLM
jgi:pimeloyl-ACP methyl ester carboxylesterase